MVLKTKAQVSFPFHLFENQISLGLACDKAEQERVDIEREQTGSSTEAFHVSTSKFKRVSSIPQTIGMPSWLLVQEKKYKTWNEAKLICGCNE